MRRLPASRRPASHRGGYRRSAGTPGRCGAASARSAAIRCPAWWRRWASGSVLNAWTCATRSATSGSPERPGGARPQPRLRLPRPGPAYAWPTARGGVLGGGGGLPQEAVGVAEVPGVAAPLCALRRLHDGAAGRDGLADDLVHGFPGVHDVVERDATEPGSLERDTGVPGRRPALVQSQRRRVAAQVQLHEAGVVLADRAAQALGVELLGPVQVLDTEHDGGHLQWHDCLPWSCVFLPPTCLTGRRRKV